MLLCPGEILNLRQQYRRLSGISLLCPGEILNLRQQYRRLSGIPTQNKNKSEFNTVSVFIVFVIKLVLKDPSTDLWKYFLNISGKMLT